MRGVAILGSTGSIGVSTLDVIARHPESYRVVALAARSDVEGMFEQCRRFRPSLAAMADDEAAARLRVLIVGEGLPTEVMAGNEGLEAVASCAYSVQYHPEAAPGPSDSLYLFERFRDEMLARRSDRDEGRDDNLEMKRHAAAD